MNRRVSGTHHDLLHERPQERLRLRKPALHQPLTHLARIRGDHLGVLHPRQPRIQLHARLIRGTFQPLLVLLVVTDARQDVLNRHLGLLHQFPQAVHPLAHLPQLQLSSLQPLTLPGDHTVHLLVHHPHEVAHVALGQDVLAYLLDDQTLEPLRAQSRRRARPLSPVQQRVAHVVRVPAPARLGGGERPTAPLALQQPAQQVRAGDAPRVHAPRRTGAQRPGNPLELLRRDDGRERVLHADRGHVVLRLLAPYQRACVHLVGEHPEDGGLQPLRAERARYAVGVEGLGDVEGRGAVQGQVEHAAHDRIGGRVQLQLGPLLRPVLHVDLPVAVGGEHGHPEPARGGFAHPPQDLLCQVLAVELVDGLDDGLHQLAGGSVVGVLRDGDDADALLAEHGLEGDRVLALAGEAGELPDEDDLEG